MKESKNKCETCFFCGEVYTEDKKLVELDGKRICPNCLVSETRICSHCGEQIWSVDNQGTLSMPLCQECYDEHYTSCSECGRIINRDDAHYEDCGDEPICHNCYEDNRGHEYIEDYYYKPAPIFYGEGKRFFGVELEVDDGGEVDDNASAVMRIGNGNGLEHIYCKHDGSLEEGFEIVTHPMTLYYHLIQALERVNRSTIVLKFPQIQPKKATTSLVLKSPETESSNRIVYLPQAVIEEFRRVKLQQEENKSMFGEFYNDYDLVICHINGRPYEMRTVDLMLYKMIEKYNLKPIVFHSLRHSSTSLKLKLSRGNIKAVQGDTGHAEARMVTDTYAHGFDADRKLIAQEMDSGFFAKVGVDDTKPETNDTLEKLKKLMEEQPEMVAELLAKIERNN